MNEPATTATDSPPSPAERRFRSLPTSGGTGEDGVQAVDASLAPEISVIVPVLDEVDSVAELVERVRTELDAIGRTFERDWLRGSHDSQRQW